MQTGPLPWRTAGVQDWRVWNVTEAAQGGGRGGGAKSGAGWSVLRELYLVRKAQKNVKENWGCRDVLVGKVHSTKF